MGTKRALLEVDPLCLPVGTRVGAWRVVAWRGRGASGTLYRVERARGETGRAYALKLAIHPGDKRFGREAWLLRHIHSRHVPRLEEQGVWEHPQGAFPYLVMQWVEGEPLYEWARERNPTSRQCLGVLSQVARALEATHAAGGVHRDVKGENVLVRAGDGRVFLTDFGAGHYRGAETLTTKLLPPGTRGYRSPEAWAFLRAFLRHPTAHYPASACDDLFALGVTGYRLVTDEYPAGTDTEPESTEQWREGGPGPRPARELNPQVSAELEAIIHRLMAVAPEERFEGQAGAVAEALEQAERRLGAEAEEPLFRWGPEQRPRWRSAGAVHRAEERDAAARERLERPRSEVPREKARPERSVQVWGAEAAVGMLGLVLAVLTVAGLYRAPALMPEGSRRASQQGNPVAVGDAASPLAATTLAPVLAEERRAGIGLSMPEKPFPDQRTPPCDRNGEVVIRGGCWYRLGDAQLPCRDDAYEWKGACYLPSYPPRRPSTSYPQ
ncbi:serine/threonine protein kinase [Hyalangium gracile]|uniref:serine/threonine protein kinase n=1 Tax=Hyalangium gracile TaxID=394092 RepID=UPI001CCA31C5|nr:serine/threonine-protein kinase [Hyalangium gracile]